MSNQPRTSFKQLRIITVASGVLLAALACIAIWLWLEELSTSMLFAVVLFAIALLTPLAWISLVRFEENIEHERKRAEQSRQTLITYVRVLSHEVRNPIAAILGSFENLQEQLNTPEQLRELSRLQQSAQTANDVLQNIVTMNKGGSPEISESRNTNLRESIESCFRIVRFSNAHGVALSYQIHDSVPEQVVCDSLRLSQILLNLLGNAVKYTKNGKVELDVRSFSASENKDSTLITQFVVTDEGIGIAPEDLEKLFVPYQQGQAEPGAGFASSGLGLSLVKQLVEEMHGEITIDSRLGVGSSFVINLPLEMAPSTRPGILSSGAVAERHSVQPRILVVEDNEINQLVAQRMLSKLGCSVTIAGDGSIACELNRTHGFDLILMDLQMPVMDGITATKNILAEEKQAPHIVAMTANVLDEERQRCIESGMSDFLAKPVKLDNLRSCLRKHGLL